jgi:hypothetical protein
MANETMPDGDCEPGSSSGARLISVAVQHKMRLINFKLHIVNT